jgi:hypothetical protein
MSNREVGKTAHTYVFSCTARVRINGVNRRPAFCSLIFRNYSAPKNQTQHRQFIAMAPKIFA